MSIWNKILIGLIFVASVAFFYLSMRALKVHQYWRDIAAKHQQALQKEAERRTLLVEGPKTSEKPGELGIRQAMLELHKLMVDRGRVWRDATPQQVEVTKDKQGQDTVKVLLQVDLPDPHQIAESANLVLFEQRDVQEKGRYLGQFTVEAVAGKQIQLKPSMKLTDAQIKRLKDSRDKWCVYEAMPVDDHEIFTDCEELDKLIPQASLAEYQKDGQPTDPNNKESAKFERKLRDYQVLFTNYHHEVSMWREQMEALTRDAQYVEAALQAAQKEVEACQADVAELKTELAKMTRERDAVAAHLKAVESLLTAKKTSLKETLARNRELAGEIARIQWEATRRIDARAQKMAQANVPQ